MINEQDDKLKALEANELVNKYNAKAYRWTCFKDSVFYTDSDGMTVYDIEGVQITISVELDTENASKQIRLVLPEKYSYMKPSDPEYKKVYDSLSSL